MSRKSLLLLEECGMSENFAFVVAALLVVIGLTVLLYGGSELVAGALLQAGLALLVQLLQTKREPRD